MCSIVGSFSKDKLIELCKLNEYRGQYSHSISYYDTQTGQIAVQRNLGAIDYGNIQDCPESIFIVVHQQAPTSTTSLNSIHPAIFQENLLWHNGILKDSQIKPMSQKIFWEETWDTYLLLRHYIEEGSLNDIDGSFSCLLYKDQKLFLFRNQIAPMFIDDDMNLSSTKFEGSRRTDADVIYSIDFTEKKLINIGEFKSKNNPYW